MTLPLLSSLIVIPFAGAWSILLFPKSQIHIVKKLTSLIALAALALASCLLMKFDLKQPALQFIEKHIWIAPWNVYYHIGMDGISLPFVWLTALLFALVSFFPPQSGSRERKFFFLLLLLESAALGCFLALDLFLFYFFWTLLPVPVYFLIGIWGGVRREYAAIKYFVTAFGGSLLFLAGVLTLYFSFLPHTFDWIELTKASFHPAFQKGIFLVFFVSFAVSIPVFLLHTWLPDAQVEAATPTSVLLAGIILKIGAYGFFRFAYSLFPDASLWFRPALSVISLFGIVYGAIAALGQTDFKKMLAYSSMSQMSWVLFGFSLGNVTSVNGALLQMFHHSLAVSGFFLLGGILYERIQTKDMRAFAGTGREMPRFTGALCFFSLAMAGLPGLSGFAAQWRILQGASGHPAIYAAAASFGSLLTLSYFIVLLRRVMRRPKHAPSSRLQDMRPKEWLLLAPLALLILAAGLYPQFFFSYTSPALQALLEKAGGLR